MRLGNQPLCVPIIEKDTSLVYTENITFSTADPSLESRLFLKGHAILHRNESRLPTIVITHGFRVSAFHYSGLLPAGMLYKNKFNVFIFDMRNHGWSDKDSHVLATYGSNEQYDLKAAMEVAMGLRSYQIQNVDKQFGNVDVEEKQKILDWTSHFVDKESIGMYGISMGGATSLTFVGHQLLQDPTFVPLKQHVKALFLDSSVCDIYQVLHSNVAQTIYSNTVANIIMKGTCQVSQWITNKDDQSCAPFSYHPLNSLERVLQSNSSDSPLAIHFDHSIDDTLVELEHTIPCVELAKKAKFEVSTHFMSTKTPEHHLRSRFKCMNHCAQSLFDLKAYEKRLARFFVKNLYNKK